MPNPRPVKVLVLTANPSDTARLRVDKELKLIIDKIRTSQRGASMTIVHEMAVEIDDISRSLLEVEPDVVHFSGHATEAHQIILEGKNGREITIEKDTFAAYFDILKGRVRVVVLNACFTAPLAQAIAKHVDCTIGMNDLLPDDAGVEFAAELYQAIAFGQPVGTAFRLGVQILDAKQLGAASIPQIFPREGVDPSELVLVKPSPKPPSDDPPARSRFPVIAIAIVATALLGVAFWKLPSGPPGTAVDTSIPGASSAATPMAAPRTSAPAPPTDNSATLTVVVPAADSAAPPASTRVVSQATSMPSSGPSATSSAPVAAPTTSATTAVAEPTKATSGTATCNAGVCTLQAGNGVFVEAFSACLDAEALGVATRCMITGNPGGVRLVSCNQSDKAASSAPYTGKTTWRRCSSR